MSKRVKKVTNQTIGEVDTYIDTMHLKTILLFTILTAASICADVMRVGGWGRICVKNVNNLICVIWIFCATPSPPTQVPTPPSLIIFFSSSEMIV